MNALKAALRPAVCYTVSRVAPLTWKFRPAGSLVVLTYHRVLPPESPAQGNEQPAMYVSPQTLDLHLNEIKRRFELVHLDEWLQWAREQKPLPRLACAITFDDGWRDNFEFALPVLGRHGAPATVFLVSGYIDGEQRFWPNRLMRLVRKAFADPGSVDFPQRLLPLIETSLAAATARGELRAEEVDRIVEGAKQFREETIRELVAEAEKSCGPEPEPREILSREEIARMAATGLVRFGCHTATHFRFDGRESPEDLEREIVLSKREIQNICDQPVDVFCYPNGEISGGAVSLVRQHYLGAVTTRTGWNTAVTDPYLISRISLDAPRSRTSNGFNSRLSCWL